MTLLFNGNTGYLEYPNKIVGTFPFSMICFGTRANSTTEQYWVTQGQTNADRIIAARHIASSDTKGLRHVEPGQSRGANKTSAPHTSSTVQQLMAIVMPSSGVRNICFGDNVFATDTNATNDGITNHNVTTIGAYHYNSLAAAGFANGNLSEAHWFNIALTAQNIADIISGAVLPNDIVGWVDGLTMQHYQESGNYPTMTGTRTFVAVGGVTQSALAHPITRAGPAVNLTAASLSQDATLSTASVTVDPPTPGTVNLAASNLTQAATLITGSVGVAPPVGTITSDPFRNYSNIVQANITIPHVLAVKMSDRSVGFSAANQVLNSEGRLVLSNSSLAIGTDYMLVTYNSDGTICGNKKYTAL